MAGRRTAVVVCVSVVLFLTLTATAQKRGPGILRVGGTEFRDVVVDDPHPWIVLFCPSACPDLYSELVDVAAQLSTIASVGFVDSLADPVLASMYGKYADDDGASIAFFPEDSSHSHSAVHQRTAKGIVTAALALIPAKHVVWMNDATLHSFLEREGTTPKVVLVTGKSNISPLYRLLSERYHTRAVFGATSADQTEVVNLIGKRSVPMLAVLRSVPSPELADTQLWMADVYVGKHTYGALVSWLELSLDADRKAKSGFRVTGHGSAVRMDLGGVIDELTEAVARGDADSVASLLGVDLDEAESVLSMGGGDTRSGYDPRKGSPKTTKTSTTTNTKSSTSSSSTKKKGTTTNKKTNSLVPQLSEFDDSIETYCYDRGRPCVISIFSTHFTDGKVYSNRVPNADLLFNRPLSRATKLSSPKYLSVATRLAKEYMDTPLLFSWIDGDVYTGFAAAFGVTPMDLPVMVVLDNRGSFTLYDGPYDYARIAPFLDSVLDGSAPFQWLGRHVYPEHPHVADDGRTGIASRINIMIAPRA